MSVNPAKPLGGKAYGSIPHLPGSRMGPADHHCHEGQLRIATEKARDKNDCVVVQEKLDGSCCSVAKIDGQILALGRAGYLAATSRFEQHHLFAEWVQSQASRFDDLLLEGERAVGEWLAQAHGTRYELHHEPFVVFDLMTGKKRTVAATVDARVGAVGLPTPTVLHVGIPLPLDAALELLGSHGHHGATDPVEGVVYRVERSGAIDYLVKWVRPDKVDGCLLPEVSRAEAVWNWRPA